MKDADLYLIATALRMLNKAEQQRLEVILDEMGTEDAAEDYLRRAKTQAAVLVN
jgi:hypothetical protein